MADEVLFDLSERVATITLNRPDKLNAIDAALGSQLIDALLEVRNNDEIRSAVITGAGRAFCAGADLTQGDGPAASAGPAGHFEASPRARFDELDAKKPLIAAINGHALGGGFEIALICDLRIGAINERARLGLPEITLGFFPLAGGPMRLPRAIPQAYANEMLFLGRRLDMQTALQWGLISRLVPADELVRTAQAMAAQIAGYAPIAVRALKELTYAQDRHDARPGQPLRRQPALDRRPDRRLQGRPQSLRRRPPTRVQRRVACRCRTSCCQMRTDRPVGARLGACLTYFPASRRRRRRRRRNGQPQGLPLQEPRRPVRGARRWRKISV